MPTCVGRSGEPVFPFVIPESSPELVRDPDGAKRAGSRICPLARPFRDDIDGAFPALNPTGFAAGYSLHHDHPSLSSCSLPTGPGLFLADLVL